MFKLLACFDFLLLAYSLSLVFFSNWGLFNFGQRNPIRTGHFTLSRDQSFFFQKSIESCFAFDGINEPANSFFKTIFFFFFPFFSSSEICRGSTVLLLLFVSCIMKCFVCVFGKVMCMRADIRAPEHSGGGCFRPVVIVLAALSTAATGWRRSG